MNQPVFSIVTPVYNADKYLKKSVESILNQKFSDFELILINDSSTDHSFNICNSYAMLDNRVTVLSLKENCGAAEARNRGMEIAKGRYLCFVDADDYIESDFLSVFYNALQEDDYDYIKCGAYEEYYDADERLLYTKVCSINDKSYQNKKDIINQVIDMELIPLFGYLWNSVYSMSIIKENKVCFDFKLKVNEDFCFNIEYLNFVKKMKCISYCGYHYAKRHGNSLSSQSKNYDYEKHLLKVNSFMQLLKTNENDTPVNLDKVFWMFTRLTYSALETGVNLSEIRQEPIFKMYRLHRFRTINDFKRVLLILILQSNNVLFIKPVVYLMHILKQKKPSFFARVKR